MHAWTYALLSFIVVGGLTFLTAALLLRLWPAVRPERFRVPLAEATRRSLLRWDDDLAPWKRALAWLGRAVRPPTTDRLSRCKQRLVWAGFHDPRAVLFFTGAKAALALAGAVAYPLYGALSHTVPPHLFTMPFILGPIGFFVPDLWLGVRVRQRQAAIATMLPDVLDLLMVCVESGMAFDGAIARVAEQTLFGRGPLHAEILRMHLEMRAGRPRAEALRALGDRTGVTEVKSMVSAFIQTECLGTSLGRSLRIHADAARARRRHRAEERAYLAPLKMLFPTVLLLMPSFLLLAMGPPFLRVVALLMGESR